MVTSSILFSRKIENIRDNSKVSLLFSNPTGSGIDKHEVLVQGVARIEDSDLDHGWERFLTDWREKEPYIDSFLTEREKFGWSEEDSRSSRAQEDHGLEEWEHDGKPRGIQVGNA